jgi:hypothetical protein
LAFGLAAAFFAGAAFGFLVVVAFFAAGLAAAFCGMGQHWCDEVRRYSTLAGLASVLAGAGFAAFFSNLTGPEGPVSMSVD